MNILELPAKVKKVLSSTQWFHATTQSSLQNILEHGIIVDHNRGGELDFGYGFYLTTTAELAESYISRLFAWQGESVTDPLVIMEYGMCPLEWFNDDSIRSAIFPAFDDNFAEFVFANRINSGTEKQQHPYDVVYGVMSDSAPTKLLTEYRAGVCSYDDVIRGLKKSNRMKQISLHNQKLCDTIQLRRAYQYDHNTMERKELDICERQSVATC